MTVHKLSCPGCGASIELPAELTRGHCVYCGSHVVVETDPRRVKIDRDDELNKSCELLKTAMQVWNLGDMFRYADRVLDIDPANALAWYCKGVATCDLSSMQADRFEEGRTYLDKALQADPDHEYAAMARKRWPLVYVRYLDQLAHQHWKVALQVWARGTMPPPFKSHGQGDAAPHAATAHATVDKALRLLDEVHPSYTRDAWEEVLLTSKIVFLDRKFTGGRFGEAGPYLRRVEALKAKGAIREDIAALPRLLDELARTEAEIATIEKRGSNLPRRKLDGLSKERDGYAERIMRAEELRDAEAGPQGEGST